MADYTSLRLQAGAGIELLRRVTALPGTGTVGERVVVQSTGIVHQWSGAVWTSLGPAVSITGVPGGGGTGEVLTKVSAADYDMVWAAGGGGGGGSPNLDGGDAASVYGGITSIDGGGA